MNIEFESSFPEHLDELVRIRIEAMRDSLTHIGRFDPDRARERFVVGFNPDYTRFINMGGVRVGFVVVKPDVSSLVLDHLYIEPEFQRRGIGGRVLQSIFSTADQLGLPMFVTALRGSDSNAFYQRHGFKYIDETEWDINYSRMPSMH
jgi:GNAT superfamily N-acetyltransferase